MSGRDADQGGRAPENLVGHSLRRGEYRVEGLLEYGGAGRLYLATQVPSDLPLIVKQLRADLPLPASVIEELDLALSQRGAGDAVSSSAHLDTSFPPSGGPHTDRFIREALLLARLNHPSIPVLCDYFFENDAWYLIFEHLAGPTLATFLGQHAPLPPLEALSYALQLCDALDYLHTQVPPVIYRDLKPTNIILTPDSRLVLLDFGQARYLKGGPVADPSVPGTPGYTSPEQQQRSSRGDERSDIYSLGVLLHEMLSGLPPIGHEVELEPLCRLNPALSPVLSALVTIATRQDPLYRFQSAHMCFQALERTYYVEEQRAYHLHAQRKRDERPAHSLPGVVTLEALPGSAKAAPVTWEYVALEEEPTQAASFASEPTQALSSQAHQRDQEMVTPALPLRASAPMPEPTPASAPRLRRAWVLALLCLLCALAIAFTLFVLLLEANSARSREHRPTTSSTSTQVGKLYQRDNLSLGMDGIEDKCWRDGFLLAPGVTGQQFIA